MTPPAVISQPVVRGTVVRVDERQGIVVLDDGRSVQTGAETVALVDGRPVQVFEWRAGMDVVLTASNPVGYRSGRYVLLNEGFGGATGFPLAPGQTSKDTKPIPTTPTFARLRGRDVPSSYS